VQGHVTIDARARRQFYTAVVAPTAAWSTARLEPRAREALGDVGFSIRARRSPLPKRIWITMDAGDGVLDGNPIRQGERRRLPRGDQRLTFRRTDGISVAVTLSLM